MKWTPKEKKRYNVGDYRILSKFLLFPMTLHNAGEYPCGEKTTKWLCFAKMKAKLTKSCISVHRDYIFKPSRYIGMMPDFWHEQEWVN